LAWWPRKKGVKESEKEAKGCFGGSKKKTEREKEQIAPFLRDALPLRNHLGDSTGEEHEVREGPLESGEREKEREREAASVPERRLSICLRTRASMAKKSGEKQ
jgi:hypothetical protein